MARGSQATGTLQPLKPAHFPNARFEDTRLVVPVEGEQDLYEPVGPGAGLPVRIETLFRPLKVGPQMYYAPPVEIPGITVADALDAADQMGALFKMLLPAPHCTITQALYHDLDDEGTGVELWFFNRAVTLAASDAAFALSDADNLAVCAPPAVFSTFRDATNNQIGLSADLPVDVYAGPGRVLYMAAKTLSTPNIAALNLPKFSFYIRANEV